MQKKNKYKLSIVGFKFRISYFWIGLYWENNNHDKHCNIWICVIPTLAFQIAWTYGEPGGYSDKPDKY